jgi:ADP-ribose pyrophosphatase
VPHLFEKKLASVQLFQGDFLQAYKDSVELSDGVVASREYVVHPGAVMVVPLLEEQGDMSLVMERQFSLSGRSGHH